MLDLTRLAAAPGQMLSATKPEGSPQIASEEGSSLQPSEGRPQARAKDERPGAVVEAWVQLTGCLVTWPAAVRAIAKDVDAQRLSEQLLPWP